MPDTPARPPQPPSSTTPEQRNGKSHHDETPPGPPASPTSRLPRDAHDPPALRRARSGWWDGAWGWAFKMVIATAVLAAGAYIGVSLGPPPAREGDSPEDGSPEGAAAYDVSAQLVHREANASVPLVSGDRVRADDLMSLSWRTSQPAYVYVLDVDDRGNGDLLFPHPLFDWKNPLPGGTQITLPGTRAGAEGAWSTSGRAPHERIVVVASPHPVDALQRLTASLHPAHDAALEYARVDAATTARLLVLVAARAKATAGGLKLDDVQPLAGPEPGVHGLWVRQVVLTNATR